MYDAVVALVKPLMLMLFKRDFRDRDRIPPRGGVIVAANHLSVADPFAIGLYLHDAGRRPRFMAKASLFRIPVLGAVLRGAGQIPVHRYSANARIALTAAADAVRAGELVVIYPEGTTTRDPDYWPMRARTGVARLALETGAPVVPVAQWGPQEFLGRRGRFRPLPRKTLRIRAGAPVDLTAYAGAKMDARTLRDCTDAIMRDVTSLVADIRQLPAPVAGDGAKGTV
ncbi:MAG: 1-acyl-sn-glycerol-3-phosphate acyltransferase [Frankiaceae bacterium]|jgi:1-acyl-sn-glycerol-3-phosphate acyltransferase|nr:1-acyl-sn-glycerol-3-phosphate acyltransferase [Frankiaceae bacterium]